MAQVVSWLLSWVGLGPAPGSRWGDRWSDRYCYAECWYRTVEAAAEARPRGYQRTRKDPDDYRSNKELLGKAFMFREWNRRRMTIVALLALGKRACFVARCVPRDILRLIGRMILRLPYELPHNAAWMPEADVCISGSRAAPK